MTPGLRILQVSNRVPYPLNEGGTIGIYNYTRGFSEAGCKVTLLALDADKHKTNVEIASAELGKYCRLKIIPINTDVRIVTAAINLFSRRSYSLERFYSEDFKIALKEELTQNEFDIIQIEGTYPAIYTDVILSLRKSAKLVLRQHNVEFEIWSRLAENATNPLKRWYFQLLSKRLKIFESNHLNQFDAIVPVTPDDGETFRKLGCVIPIFPSPAGIDTHYWRPSRELENPHYLYHIGSLEWMPNVEALIWFIEVVWPLIQQQLPELQFYVAGKGMSPTISNLQIQGVHMMGEVDDAASFIENKSVNIVPLKSGSGIRLKILEAMSAGKAVVSTTIGAQGINYVDGEHLRIANTAEEFAKTVVELTSNPDEASRIKSNARRQIEEHYSNQRVVDKLLKFYRDL